MAEAARIEQLRVGADPANWTAFGFTVAEGELTIGATTVRLRGADDPVATVEWSLSGVDGPLDGLPTNQVQPSGAPSAAAEHPNGALAIDHVVVFTPDLERTIGAFESAGVRCRRVREVGPAEQPLRQAFFRFAEVIVEVVQVPSEQAGADGAARIWGLTLTVADLEGMVAELGDRCGTIRNAVQAGRRIATVHREAGLGLPIALISPQPPR